MPVLDVRSLSSKQLGFVTDIYDRLSNQGLQPLAQLKTDGVRCEIDEAIRTMLNIPKISFVRDLLDREPGMTARDLATRNAPADGYVDEDDEEEQSDLF